MSSYWSNDLGYQSTWCLKIPQLLITSNSYSEIKLPSPKWMTNKIPHNVNDPPPCKLHWCKGHCLDMKFWGTLIILETQNDPFLHHNIYCTCTIDQWISGWCNRLWHPIYGHPLLCEAASMMAIQICAIFELLLELNYDSFIVNYLNNVIYIMWYPTNLF